MFVKYLFFIVCYTLSYGYARRSDDDGEIDRILLENVKALTLFKGRITNGRRSSGVPQLNCVGGTAGCKAFVPSVVQCINVGSDGFDVQWECKTDMDDSYRFGKIQVNCEGYDYPNDRYVLKGSCGLEYTIDYTENGRRNNHWGNSNSHLSNYTSSSASWLPLIVIVGLVVFVIYKMRPTDNLSDNNRTPPSQPHDSSGHGGRHSPPPPYGFKPEYTRMGGGPPPTYSDVSGGQSTSNHFRPNVYRNDGQFRPGFWSGIGVGGLAGYLFGSRNNRNSYGYNQPYGHGHSYGGGYSHNYGWNTGSSSTPTLRSRTSRTASGFGGTTRR